MMIKEMKLILRAVLVLFFPTILLGQTVETNDTVKGDIEPVTITVDKLIMWNIITLDGCFEGNKNWDLSFHEVIWGEELKKISIEQLKSADFLVFGRITYEGMAAHWPKAKGEIAELMNKIPKLVFSKTLKSVDWENSTLIKDNSSAEISKLKAQGDGDMYVFGSANLSGTFINDNLFDEYRIGIAPVILGSGRPLFGQGISSKNLSLVSTHQFSTGGVVLKYTK